MFPAIYVKVFPPSLASDNANTRYALTKPVQELCEVLGYAIRTFRISGLDLHAWLLSYHGRKKYLSTRESTCLGALKTRRTTGSMSQIEGSDEVLGV